MMWKKIEFILPAVQKASTTTQNSQEKPVSFYLELLEAARDFPSLEIIFPDQIEWGYELIEKVISDSRPLSLSVHHQQIKNMPMEWLRHSTAIWVELDEFLAPQWDLTEFYDALAWAIQKGIPVNVRVNLTEWVLARVTEHLLLPRLLDQAHKIEFHVPKNSTHPLLSRAQFGKFLDYIAMEMLKMRVLKKIDIDACMVPALSLTPRKNFPRCAKQGILSVLPDGGVKLCPYGPIVDRIEKIDDFFRIKSAYGRKRYRELLAHCKWREDWNLQEPKKKYLIRQEAAPQTAE